MDRGYLKKLLSAILLIAGLLLLSACGALSKTDYEAEVKQILEQGKSDLSGDQAETTATLERMKSEIDALNAPDDFFSGHSDIKEFLELIIKSRKAADPALASGARQALERARRELPFLDYELNQAFGNLVRQAGSTGPPSGFTPPASPPAGQPGSPQRPFGASPPPPVRNQPPRQ